MPRILTNLRIDEVSVVDKGAGKNCKILISKRDDSTDKDDVYQTDWYKEQVTLAERQNEEHLRKNDAEPSRFYFNKDTFLGKSYAADARGDEADRHDEEASADELVGDGSANDHHASKVADLLVESGKHPDRQAALDHLLHTASGAALLRRLTKHREEITMSKKQLEAARTAKLRDMAKRGGTVELAKAIASEGKTFGLNESDLVDLISYHDQRSGESAAQTFARNYESPTADGLAFRKAVQVAKELASLTPIVVNGNTDNPDDAREATDALTRLVEEQRARAPWMTAEQLYEEVMRKNPELTAKAFRRPAATSIYPFPK